MSGTAELVEIKHCCFCHKNSYEVAWLIQSHDAFICDACVDLCAQIVREQRAQRDGSEDSPSPGAAEE